MKSNELFASQILRTFADQRRRVVSSWRVRIVAGEIAIARNEPLSEAAKGAILNLLLRRGHFKPAAGVEGVYVVNVPYANLLDFSEEQIVQEANPWAVFGFLTAMSHNGLTDLIPKQLHVIDFAGSRSWERVPLGTTPEDWIDLSRPRASRPKRIGEIEVCWTKISEKEVFGVTIGQSFGLPIYVTDPERTLLDALRMPDKSGGIAKVLQAWKGADRLNVNRLLDYVDRFDIQNLRQRVGFLLESLGREHPRLDDWRQSLRRGGSLKLAANLPYAPTYSGRWNLSLNVPPAALAVLNDKE